MSRARRRHAGSMAVKRESEKPRAILVFGEDHNDAEAICALAEGLDERLAKVMKPLREPLVLHKMHEPRRLSSAQRIALVITANRVCRDVRATIKHEDCDALEPAHDDARTRIEVALRNAGIDPIFAVTPAWEIEAWWFLFPDAVKAAFPSWAKPDGYVGKHVGRISNAKETFARAVTPKGAKPTFRGYAESDSPRIAASVRDRGEAAKPRGQSGSYAEFRAIVAACAARL